MGRERIHIYTDSRGKGLQAYLQKEGTTAGADITVHVRSGATFQQLAKLSEERKKDTGRPWDFAIIAGGICNLTSIHWEGGNKILKYIRDEQKTRELKDSIKGIKQRFGSNIIISTIPPAILANSNSDNPPTGQQEQQQQLDEDLEEVNDLVRSLAIDSGSVYLNLFEKSTSRSIKKRSKDKGQSTASKQKVKIKVKNFPDGVHADDELKTVWFNRINQLINSEITARGKKRDADTSSSGEEANFKRRRR